MATPAQQLAIIRAMRLLAVNAWGVTNRADLANRITITAQKRLEPFSPQAALSAVEAIRTILEPLGWQVTRQALGASPIEITITNPPLEEQAA